MTGQSETVRRQHADVLLYILHCGNLYGTERMALATLSGMPEYKKRVVFAPKPFGSASVAAAAQAAGYESVQFETRWELAKALLPWFIRYRKLDVIGTGVAQSLTCFVLAKLLFVKLRQIQVVHGGTEDHHAYGRKRALNRIPVQTVAVSEFVRSKLIANGMRPDKISIIDNFLSDEQRRQYPARPPYDPNRRNGKPIDPTRIKVAIVSRVDPIKKIDLVVAAVERYGLREFQFDVYGTGADLDVLRERSAGLSNVHFHGFVADVKDRLAGADFLLHLCPEEPFGLVVLEAFLSKLVVIVPDKGGSGTLVEDGVTGFRFPADDVEALDRVLRRVARLESDVLQRVADAGFATLDDRFSQREGVRRYREALAGKRVA